MNFKELSRALHLATLSGFHAALLLIGALVLSVVGLVCLAHGTREMLTDSKDYRMHWIEERYVYRGKNPADIFARLEAEAQHKPIPHNGRDSSVDPDLGPADGAYPLWSYFTGAFFTWPPTFAAGRIYNAILNYLVLCGILYWTFKLGAREHPLLGLTLTASVFAVNSISTTFFVGQYGVQVVGALIASYLLSESKRWMWSGIFFGIAMVKLSIAAPFALAFVVKGRWRMLFAATAYLMMGTLVIWPLVKTNPVEVLSQMTAAAGHYEAKGYSFNNLIESLGIEPQLAMKLAAVTTLSVTLAVMYRWRASSLLTLYAVAAFSSRAWCYHRQYDNVVLLFLLISLGITAWRTWNAVAIFSYLLVGVSLWLPGRLTNSHEFIIVQWLMWIEGVGAVLYLEAIKPAPRGETADPASGFDQHPYQQESPVARG